MSQPLTDLSIERLQREIKTRIDADAAAPYAELLMEARRRLKELVALQTSSVAISQPLDPSAVGDRVIRVIESLLPYERCAIVVAEGSELKLVAHSSLGLDQAGAELENARVRKLIRESDGKGVIRWVVNNGRTLSLDDVGDDPRYIQADQAMRSELCVPILLGERTLGAINVESRSPGAFSEHDKGLLETIANQVAVALENARLYRELQRELDCRASTELALRDSEEKNRLLVEHANEAILVVREDRIEFANPRSVSLTGYSRHALRAKSLCELIHPDDWQEIASTASGGADTPRPGGSYHLRILTKERQVRWVELNSVTALWNGAPAVLNFIRDITDARSLTEQLSHQASHDDLTGLVNRREFERRLHAAWEACRTRRAEHALCYIDLDQFKVVNDTAGHAAGDELLRRLGEMLPQFVRKRDTLARLGGDEFGVLLEDCALDQAQRVAENLRVAIEEFRFACEGRAFQVGACIGLVPVTWSSGNVAAILSAADAACYAAKEHGRNRVHVYADDDEDLARRQGDMRWVPRLQSALEENRFKLAFQPIVPLGGAGQGHHYELLLRLRDEHGATLMPGSFLPAAERFNLGPRLDRWVVQNTLSWLESHPEHVQHLHLCSINLSGQSLGDNDFLDFVIRQFKATGIAMDKICFEVTETSAIANLRAAMNFFEALKSRGCKFALDDFGSGLSSFEYLRRLPIDYLKIDGMFVKDMLHDEIDAAMVKSINEIGQVMEKQTIAEFVEDDATLERLREIGVNYAQGYGIGRPLPIAELVG